LCEPVVHREKRGIRKRREGEGMNPTFFQGGGEEREKKGIDA